VGIAYYYMGKGAKNPELLGYKFTSVRGNALLKITSPRVGIVKVGEGLFGITPYIENPASIANAWFRIATLFHEAHHSDGNGKSLGFSHAVCPEGHKYFNYNACDRETNGPYAVGAILLKQARATCMAQYAANPNSGCNPKEAEVIANLMVDSVSRILPGTTMIDPRPEGLPSMGQNPGI
jgi:hypothetical protein